MPRPFEMSMKNVAVRQVLEQSPDRNSAQVKGERRERSPGAKSDDEHRNRVQRVHRGNRIERMARNCCLLALVNAEWLSRQRLKLDLLSHHWSSRISSTTESQRVWNKR